MAVIDILPADGKAIAEAPLDALLRFATMISVISILGYRLRFSVLRMPGV